MKKNNIYWLSRERELCKECGYPDGFCCHTIEEQYKEYCPKTPLKKEDKWFLTRQVALHKTWNNNLLSFRSNELKEMDLVLKEVCERQENLKKMFKEIKENLEKSEYKKGRER